MVTKRLFCKMEQEVPKVPKVPNVQYKKSKCSAHTPFINSSVIVKAVLLRRNEWRDIEQVCIVTTEALTSLLQKQKQH